MTQLKDQEIRAAFAEIAKRVESSAEFRSRALKDPAAVLREVLGAEVPTGMSLQIVELEGGELEMYLSSSYQSEDLTDADLQYVSGGRFVHYSRM